MGSLILTKKHPLELSTLRFNDSACLSVASRIVQATHLDENGCLIWRNSKDHDGYGVTFFRKHQWRVHRLVFLLWVNDIPTSMFVCHRCDIPMCCHPDHLFLGDARSNRIDCRNKGRIPLLRGPLRHNAILTESKVRDIRSRYQWRGKNNSAVALSKEFGTSIGAIWGVLRYKTWKYI